MKTAGLK